MAPVSATGNMYASIGDAAELRSKPLHDAEYVTIFVVVEFCDLHYSRSRLRAVIYALGGEYGGHKYTLPWCNIVAQIIMVRYRLRLVNVDDISKRRWYRPYILRCRHLHKLSATVERGDATGLA